MKGSEVRTLHIADFGISRIMSTEGGVNVLASTVLGTPSFMAPEVLKNQRYDAFKADSKFCIQRRLILKCGHLGCLCMK